MTARIATYFLLGLLVCTELTGCTLGQRRKPPVVPVAYSAEEAPKFDLAFADEPTISLVSNHLAPPIRFVDARSDIEKRYYPGETDPQRSRDALTILPMESFQPGIEQAIRRSLLKSLDDALMYESIEVKVMAFQMALDERERAAEELLYDYKNWDDDREVREQQELERKRLREQQERETRQLQKRLGLRNMGDDDDDDFGDAVATGLFNMTVVEPLKKRRLRKERAARFTVAPQTLPMSLTQDKQPGWNCRIELELLLHSDDGSMQTISVRVRQHADKDLVTPVTEQMPSLILSSLNEIEEQIRQSGK